MGGFPLALAFHSATDLSFADCILNSYAEFHHGLFAKWKQRTDRDGNVYMYTDSKWRKMLSTFEGEAISPIGFQINCPSTNQATIIFRDLLIGMY